MPTSAARILPAEGLPAPEERFLRGPLFNGVSPGECARMLSCLGARERRYSKSEAVMRRGDSVKSVGLVLEGRLTMERSDPFGGRSILGTASAGDVFGEAYAASGEPCGVDVVAATDCLVARLDLARVLTTCPSACSFHARLISNLVRAMAQRNIALTRKIADVTPRTIRGRLMSFLSEQAQLQGVGGKRGEEGAFEVPYTRQQLADYLCVDRSALSTELSKMRAEGLVGFEKSRFWLMGPTG